MIFLSMLLAFQISYVDAEKIKIDGGEGHDTMYLWGSPDDLKPAGLDLQNGAVGFDWEFVDPNGKAYHLTGIETVVVYQQSISNEQRLPLTATGESRGGHDAMIVPPIVWTVAPANAGEVVDSKFVPAANYVGVATVTASATAKNGKPIEGEIVIGVTEPPAVRIVITAGEPEDQ